MRKNVKAAICVNAIPDFLFVRMTDNVVLIKALASVDAIKGIT